MIKDKNGIPNWYQVKYRYNGSTGPWSYGIVDQYSKEAKQCWKSGDLVIEDAILSRRYRVPKNGFEIRPLGFNIRGEYDKFVEKEFKKALAHSKRTRCLVGKLFRMGVGDGYAFYVVKDIKKNQVEIEWRSYQGDRYYDQALGGGGWFPKSMILRLVRMEDAMREIFGG